MIEKVHFSYDLDFVLQNIASIGVEKIICVNKKVIEINGKEYSRLDLDTKHCEELNNRTIGSFLLSYLEEKYPDGCMIDTPMFDELTNVYLNHLCENSLELINYDKSREDSYVQSKSLNKRIYCNGGQHYGACLNLACKFFGRGDYYSTEDICNWIKNDITVVSSFTSVDRIINDFKMLGANMLHHYENQYE